jgi:uncharacterized repeat protein (TIGR03803 family)
LAPDGTNFSLLHTFNNAEGGEPEGTLLLGSDGALYGTTASGGTHSQGTVFRLPLPSSTTAAFFAVREGIGVDGKPIN